jgi:hypothetical protein
MGICVTKGTGVFVGNPDEVTQQMMLWSIPQFPLIVQTGEPAQVLGSEFGAHII